MSADRATRGAPRGTAEDAAGEPTGRADDEAIAALRRFDTPTVCNGLELLHPESRLAGYTDRTLELACAGPIRAEGGPRAVCGRALTARIRSRDASPHPADARSAIKADWYEHVASGGPGSIVVVEDLDDEPLGAFWGEVHTALHRALGAAGAVTNGVVRDLDDLDPDFFLAGGRVAPSHAHVHWVDFGRGATVFGMAVADGDVVHADRHGAVVVPEHAVARLPEAIAEVQAREARVLEIARAEGPVDLAALRALVGAAPASVAAKAGAPLGTTERAR